MKHFIQIAAVTCLLVTSLYSQEKEQVGSAYFQAVDEYKVKIITSPLSL